jgi:hypothetical protein
MSTLLIGKYQATIYPEDNGYVGAISLGFDGRGNLNRTGIARGRGSGHRALLGDDLTIHGFPFNGGHVVDR